MDNRLTLTPPREIVSTITTKGQVTIPVEVRQFLHVRSHDKIAFVIEEGQVRLKPLRYSSIDALRGAAGSLPHDLPWQEVLRIAREDATAAQPDAES